MGSLRYGRIDSTGLWGGSFDREGDLVTVLERVLVLGRRERLTQLAMLELLSTERIEPGLECSMVSRRLYSQGLLLTRIKPTRHQLH